MVYRYFLTPQVSTLLAMTSVIKHRVKRQVVIYQWCWGCKCISLLEVWSTFLQMCWSGKVKHLQYWHETSYVQHACICVVIQMFSYKNSDKLKKWCHEKVQIWLLLLKRVVWKACKGIKKGAFIWLAFSLAWTQSFALFSILYAFWLSTNSLTECHLKIRAYLLTISLKWVYLSLAYAALSHLNTSYYFPLFLVGSCPLSLPVVSVSTCLSVWARQWGDECGASLLETTDPWWG